MTRIGTPSWRRVTKSGRTTHDRKLQNELPPGHGYLLGAHAPSSQPGASVLSTHGWIGHPDDCVGGTLCGSLQAPKPVETAAFDRRLVERSPFDRFRRSLCGTVRHDPRIIAPTRNYRQPGRLVDRFGRSV